MAKVKITGHASGSGVITVTAPNTSTDRTITLPDATDTLIGATTTDALTTRVNSSSGRKNMLINGDMRVAQRGTSFSNTTQRQYTTDRWSSAVGSSFNLDTTITQSTTVPSGEGFKYSLKVEADSVVTPSGSDNGGVMQSLEKSDVERLCYGTSSAKSLTLSFWTRSNKTGIYCVAIMQNMANLDGNTRYSHIKEYTISSANTWEKKTITFSGNTAQVMDASSSETTDGLRICWWLATGSSDHNTGDTWYATPSFGSTSNQVNFMDSASNEWYLTGCQLELGSVATDFEYRRYGEEIKLCERYYQKLTGSYAAYGQIANMNYNSASQAQSSVVYRTEMRAAPTLSHTSTSSNNSSSAYAIANGSSNSGAVDYIDGLLLYNPNTISTLLYTDGSAGGTAREAGNLYVQSAITELALVAELT